MRDLKEEYKKLLAYKHDLDLIYDDVKQSLEKGFKKIALSRDLKELNVFAPCVGDFLSFVPFIVAVNEYFTHLKAVNFLLLDIDSTRLNFFVMLAKNHFKLTTRFTVNINIKEMELLN